MICKNCNAPFDDNLPKCPYCGAFHYAGARKEYMGKLEGMREALDDLHETVPQMYTAELKKQGKQTRKMILTILAVLGVLTILVFGFHAFTDSLYQQDAKATLLFTKEAFPIADEYYAAGDYEGLLEFYQTSIKENENADFYNWEHYTFLICYENYILFQESAARFDTEEFSDFDMREIFYCYLSNRYHQKGDSLAEEDFALVIEYEEEMEAFINTLQLTSEEQEELNNLLNSNEYSSWDTISDFGKKIYRRLQKEK